MTESNLPHNFTGFLPGALQVGNVLGCFIFGYFSNHFGRRMLFIYGDVLTISGLLMIVCVESKIMLLLGLFLIGTGTGSDMVLGNSIAFETFPPSHRCRLGALNTACSIGSMGTYGTALLSTYFLSQYPDS